MSLYDALDLPRDATIEQINAAYRRKAREHHPDAGGSADVFAGLQQAVSILRDPERRARYDATGDTGDLPDAAAEARELFVTAFIEMLGNAGDRAASMDLVGLTSEHLRNLGAELGKQLGAASKRHKALTDALDRLSHTGDTPDLVGIALTSNAEAVSRQLAEIERKQGVVKAAREMASSYQWRVDKPEPQQWTVALGGLTGQQRPQWSTTV